MSRERPLGAGTLKYQPREGLWLAGVAFPGGKQMRRRCATEEEGEEFLRQVIAKHIDELGYFYRRLAKVGRPDRFPRRPNRPRGGVTIRRRWQVLERDNHRCVYCGNTPNEARIVVDHVVPVASGGSDELDNLVAACVPCNAGKWALRLAAG